MKRRRHRATLVGIVSFVCAACGTQDLAVPWDRTEMIQQITADLRHFEHLPAEPSDLEVLAWRVVETVREVAKPTGLPPW